MKMMHQGQYRPRVLEQVAHRDVALDIMLDNADFVELRLPLLHMLADELVHVLCHLLDDVIL